SDLARSPGSDNKDRNRRSQAMRRCGGIWSSVIGGSLSSPVGRTCVAKNVSGEAFCGLQSRVEREQRARRTASMSRILSTRRGYGKTISEKNWGKIEPDGTGAPRHTYCEEDGPIVHHTVRS